MFYPTMTEPVSSRVSQAVFGGLNRQPVIGAGEFASMANLSSRCYPAAATRLPRGKIDTLHTVATAGMLAMLDKDALVWLDAAGTIHAGAYALEGFASLSDSRPKRLVSMGAYVCLFPDKKWINASRLLAGTLTAADYGSMESATQTEQAVNLSMCTRDVASYANVTVSTSMPTNAVNGAYWLDTASSPRQLRRWSASDGTWVTVTGTCVKLAATGLGAAFRVGDAVHLCHLGLLSQPAALNAQIAALMDSPHVVRACSDDYLVVDGVLDNACLVPVYHNRLMYDIVDQSDAYTLEQLENMDNAALETILDTLPQRHVWPVKISRTVPDLDYVVECGNRLWGCRYDPGAPTPINEIYACALGDFTNWWRYEGLASDAYAASRGADGPFTGAVCYGGCALFFRERCLEKVYPSASGAHQIVVTPLDGVAAGCGDSLQSVDGVLYYLARAGVMAYDGSLPTCVSAKLASGAMVHAVAGRLGHRYYLSVQTGENSHLLVYDTRLNVWHREDGLQVQHCCSVGEDLYLLDSGGQLWSVLASAGQQEGDFDWQMETGLLGLESPDKQFAGRIDLRLQLQPGSQCTVQAQYDSDGQWHTCAAVRAATLRSFTLPVRPRRCDHLRLRLTGRGGLCLYSITRRTQEGSER